MLWSGKLLCLYVGWGIDSRGIDGQAKDDREKDVVPNSPPLEREPYETEQLTLLVGIQGRVNGTARAKCNIS